MKILLKKNLDKIQQAYADGIINLRKKNENEVRILLVSQNCTIGKSQFFCYIAFVFHLLIFVTRLKKN